MIKFPGIDNTVCTFGGLLRYHPSSTLRMRAALAPSNLRILLINTRVSRNTKALVERVRTRAMALPKVMSRILEAMDSVSHVALDTLDAMRVALEDGDSAQVDSLFQVMEVRVNFIIY